MGLPGKVVSGSVSVCVWGGNACEVMEVYLLLHFSDNAMQASDITTICSEKCTGLAMVAGGGGVGV